MSNLKKLLKEKNISQKDLAEKIGKARSTVSEYVNGKQKIPSDIIEEIAKILDCNTQLIIDNNKQDTAIVVPDYIKQIEFSKLADKRNVSVEEAAKLLNKPPQFIRIALQQKRVDFGFAVKFDKQYSYHISGKKLAEYIINDETFKYANQFFSGRLMY